MASHDPPAEEPSQLQGDVNPQTLAQATTELMAKATPEQVAAGERHFASMPIEKQQTITAAGFPPHYAYFREMAFRSMADPARQQAVMPGQNLQPGVAMGQRPSSSAPTATVSEQVSHDNVMV